MNAKIKADKADFSRRYAEHNDLRKDIGENSLRSPRTRSRWPRPWLTWKSTMETSDDAEAKEVKATTFALSLVKNPMEKLPSSTYRLSRAAKRDHWRPGP